MGTRGQKHVTVTWELFQVNKTRSVNVHMSEAFCDSLGEGRRQQLGPWPWGQGHYTLQGGHLLISVSVEQPSQHRPSERLLGGEKGCCESRRWGKASSNPLSGAVLCLA